MDACDARHSFQDYLIHHDRFAQIPNHPLLGRHLTQVVVIFGLPHPPPLRSVGTNPGERPGGSKYPCSLPTVPLREKSEALRRGYA